MKKKTLYEQIKEQVWEFLNWHQKIGNYVFYGNSACSKYDLLMGYDAEYSLHPRTQLVINHRGRAYRNLLQLDVHMVVNNGVFFYGKNKDLAEKAYQEKIQLDEDGQKFVEKMQKKYGWELPFLEKFKIRFKPEISISFYRKEWETYKFEGLGYLQLIDGDKVLTQIQTWNAYQSTPDRLYVEDIAGYSIYHDSKHKNCGYYHISQDDIFVIKYEGAGPNFGVQLAPDVVERFFVKISPYWEFAVFCSMMLHDIDVNEKMSDIRICDAYCSSVSKIKSMFTRDFSFTDSIPKGQVDLFIT